MRDPLQIDYIHYFSTPLLTSLHGSQCLCLAFRGTAHGLLEELTTYNRALLAGTVVSATFLINKNNTDEYLSR